MHSTAKATTEIQGSFSWAKHFYILESSTVEFRNSCAHYLGSKFSSITVAWISCSHGCEFFVSYHMNNGAALFVVPGWKLRVISLLFFPNGKKITSFPFLMLISNRNIFRISFILATARLPSLLLPVQIQIRIFVEDVGIRLRWAQFWHQRLCLSLVNCLGLQTGRNILYMTFADFCWTVCHFSPLLNL